MYSSVSLWLLFSRSRYISLSGCRSVNLSAFCSPRVSRRRQFGATFCTLLHRSLPGQIYVIDIPKTYNGLLSTMCIYMQREKRVDNCGSITPFTHVITFRTWWRTTIARRRSRRYVVARFVAGIQKIYVSSVYMCVVYMYMCVCEQTRVSIFDRGS